MSKFADVYFIPIQKKNLAKYRKLAGAAGKIFVRHGAMRYREYVEGDLNAQGVTAFPKVIKIKKGEVLLYASVEFKSKAHRNKVMKSIMKDPEMGKIAPKKPIFDMKRMIYGGFRIIVDL